MKGRKNDRCPLCGGAKKPGTTTFTADLGFGVVLIRNVPATVCSQCGTDWIADDVAVRIEEVVDDAQKKHLQLIAGLPLDHDGASFLTELEDTISFGPLTRPRGNTTML